MKKFISGFLAATLVFGLAISALAVSGNVSFNLSAIKFNGEVISEVGEGYTLSNGCVAPASITYTDEKGGGTTYLPARRVSELLDVDIGWDSASGAVTIGDAAPATPDTSANAPDYSDWSAEDEAAYQEFKGMWEVRDAAEKFANIPADMDGFICIYNGPETVDWLKAQVEASFGNGFSVRLADELRQKNSRVAFQYYCKDILIGYFDSAIQDGSVLG